MICRE